MDHKLVKVQITYNESVIENYQLFADDCFFLIRQVKDETLASFELQGRFYLKKGISFIHFDSILDEETREVKRGSMALQFHEVSEK